MLLQLDTCRPDRWRSALYPRLLVPLDRSVAARHARDQTAILARQNGAVVVLLHVIEESQHGNGFRACKVRLDDMRPRWLAAG